jgi:hypothetical protein
MDGRVDGWRVLWLLHAHSGLDRRRPAGHSCEPMVMSSGRVVPEQLWPVGLLLSWFPRNSSVAWEP